MKYVLYHDNCYDGFGAAYACWKKFGDQAKYIAVQYNKPFPVEYLDQGDEVYIVDFSYSYDQIHAIAQNCQKVYVFDHHKTAREELENKTWPDSVQVIFDMEKSGALITWEQLHPSQNLTTLEKELDRWVLQQNGVPIPKLIAHISDRDLWKFELDGSAKIHKALVSYPMDFKLWDGFDVENLKIEGASLERMYNQLVENICKSSWRANLGKHRNVPMVNTSIAWSEVGHALLKKYPDADFVASFTEFEKETMWSLRSKENYDCSVVAKEFGGGGHKQASGFKLTKP